VLRILIHILVLRPLLKLFSGVTVIGKENLTQLDRYIIIANHNSHLDIFVLFGLIPVRDIRRTRAVAAKEYFSKNRLMYTLVRFLFDPVFVARGSYDRTKNPLDEIGAIIGNNRNIIVFPEGSRGIPGEIQPFKSGIGRLVSRCPNVPIIPVFLSGPERALPKASSLLLPFWNFAVVGPPRICTGTHRDITRELEQALIELSRSESARRHKRSTQKVQRTLSIAFLGIDGSGKSTVSEMTARALSASSAVSFVGDRLDLYEQGQPKDVQPFMTEKVRHAISLYAKKAKSLKMYKIPKLAELMLRNRCHHELERWYVSDFIILDGSPLLNMTAWASLYKREAFDDETCAKAISILTGNDSAVRRNDPIFRDFPELTSLRSLRLNSLILPDIVLFIDTPPVIACERIDSRGERKQVHETVEKLTDLRNAYLKVCDVLKRTMKIPVTILDGKMTRDEVTANAIEFITATTTENE